MKPRRPLLSVVLVWKALVMLQELLCSRMRWLHVLLSFSALFTGTVSGITCHCSQCNEFTNHTCSTSSSCVFFASRDSEESSWTSSYGCLQDTDTATVNCDAPSTSKRHIVCCKNNLCNLHLKMPEPTTTDIVNNPETGSQEPGTNFVMYVVAAVAVFMMVVLTVVILVTYLKYHRAHHRALQQQLDQDVRSRSAFRREQDGRLHCRCCQQREWGRGSPSNQSLCEQGRSRNNGTDLPPPTCSQKSHWRHKNGHKPHTHYSVQADIGRPPFAVRVDPVSQNPVPSTRHHLQLALHPSTDHSTSTSTGSDSTTWSGMSAEYRRPLTGSEDR